MVYLLSLTVLFSVLATFARAGNEKIPAGVIQIDTSSMGDQLPVARRMLMSVAGLRSGSVNGPIESEIFRYTVDSQGKFSLAALPYFNKETQATEWKDTEGLKAGEGYFSVYDPPATFHDQHGEIFCQLRGKLDNASEGVSFSFGTAAGGTGHLAEGFDFFRDTCEGVAKNGVTVTCQHAAACVGAGIL